MNDLIANVIINLLVINSQIKWWITDCINYCVTSSIDSRMLWLLKSLVNQSVDWILQQFGPNCDYHWAFTNVGRSILINRLINRLFGSYTKTEYLSRDRIEFGSESHPYTASKDNSDFVGETIHQVHRNTYSDTQQLSISKYSRLNSDFNQCEPRVARESVALDRVR